MIYNLVYKLVNMLLIGLNEMQYNNAVHVIEYNRISRNIVRILKAIISLELTWQFS